MGILNKLTREYFGDVERDEDIILPDNVDIVSFTDCNKKLHKKGYQPKNKKSLKDLLDILIEKRGNDGSFNDIDVHLITDMGFLFYKKTSFNGDITGWDVSKVVDMSGIFLHAESFNQPIGKWNVENVEVMFRMFESASSFNQDISNWNVEKVENKLDVFSGCPIRLEYKPKFLPYLKVWNKKNKI